MIGAQQKRKTLLLMEHGRMMKMSQESETFLSGAPQSRATSTSIKGRERHTSVVGNLHRGSSLELIDLNSSRCGFSDVGDSSRFCAMNRQYSSRELGSALEQDFRHSSMSVGSLVATLVEELERGVEIPEAEIETSISDINSLVQKVERL
jgi:hypothetical protein